MSTAQQFIEAWGIHARYQVVAENPHMTADSEWAKTARHYEVTLMYRHKGQVYSYTTYYSKGSAHTTGPNRAEVLQSLSMDIAGLDNTDSFEDWALEYGYDTDSRAAERTYRVIVKMAQDIKNWLSPLPANAWAQFKDITEEDE